MNSNKNKITVFGGGTCNGSKWRDLLIPLLNDNISFFNPVVPNWTPECQAAEIKAREESDYVLYVLTPKMTGFYSVCEVTEDSNKRPSKTLFCYLDSDGETTFNTHQKKSLEATAKLLIKNGATVFGDLSDVALWLNTREKSTVVPAQMVTITEKEYDDLLDDSIFLEALRSAGVDNWDGYGFALEALEEEEEEEGGE